jgi:hypothetical protein
MTRITSTQITKPESDTRHRRDQEVAQRPDKQDSATKEQTTEVKPFVVEERVYLRTDNIHVKQRSKKNNKA